MPYPIQQNLINGVTSRALFNWVVLACAAARLLPLLRNHNRFQPQFLDAVAPDAALSDLGGIQVSLLDVDSS
jgi:hypothetical protein